MPGAERVSLDGRLDSVGIHLPEQGTQFRVGALWGRVLPDGGAGGVRAGGARGR